MLGESEGWLEVGPPAIVMDSARDMRLLVLRASCESLLSCAPLDSALVLIWRDRDDPRVDVVCDCRVERDPLDCDAEESMSKKEYRAYDLASPSVGTFSDSVSGARWEPQCNALRSDADKDIADATLRDRDDL